MKSASDGSYPAAEGSSAAADRKTHAKGSYDSATVLEIYVHKNSST